MQKRFLWKGENQWLGFESILLQKGILAFFALKAAAWPLVKFLYLRKPL
jgi:hypothetical protein